MKRRQWLLSGLTLLPMTIFANAKSRFSMRTGKGLMEAFFKATSEWTTPPSPAEIAKVFEEHEMKVVGPPLQVD